MLSEEKNILRQIDALKRTKVQCEERNKHEQAIRETKAELSALRDSFSLIIASIDELAPVLNKVELANKLQCSTTELKTVTVDCPKEKMRHVIGKNGATVKQIMERTRVAIDVDSDKGQIEITGSQSALILATNEIRRITEAVEEDIRVSSALVEYLTTRVRPERMRLAFSCIIITFTHKVPFKQRVHAFVEFREQHPAVFIDVSRNSTTVHLEGLAEDVFAAKDALFSMNVKQESRSLTSIEAGVVVGKKGVNINQLVDENKVSIDVDSVGEDFKVRVTGPSENVDAAMASIEELLDLNKEVEESVPINAIARSILLNAGGARIKELQKDVNEKTKEVDGIVFLSIEKNARLEDSALIVKGRRTTVASALDVVSKGVKDMMDSVVTIQVGPYVAPRLIGKGGANIKKMKSQGNGVVIEVGTTGKVELYGSDEDVKAVAQSIQTVVDENHEERLDFDPSCIKPMFRALVRDKSKEINAIVSGMDLDEEDSQIVLRGTVENVSHSSPA